MKDFGQQTKSLKTPLLRINLKDADLRKGPKDRRRVHTYVARDRRSGIADRRRDNL